jgi:hypothetical protein
VGSDRASVTFGVERVDRLAFRRARSLGSDWAAPVEGRASADAASAATTVSVEVRNQSLLPTKFTGVTSTIAMARDDR